MWSKYKDTLYQCVMVAVGCAIFGAGLVVLDGRCL